MLWAPPRAPTTHSHSRMKLIDIRRAHFIRNLVNGRLIDVNHIPGAQNPTDLLAYDHKSQPGVEEPLYRSSRHTMSVVLSSCTVPHSLIRI